MRIFGLIVALVALCSNANAGIILTVGNGSFAQGAGTATIDVFVRSDANDSTAGLEVAFDLTQGGTFNAVPGSFGAGFFGAGNLTGGSGFVTASPFTSSVLNLEFTTSQLFPSSDVKIATLSIDKTGLGEGTYSIVASGLFTEAAVNTSFNGSFTITAVPEPTTLAFLGFACSGVVGSRLIRRKKSRNI
jgi:hypothetical protein